MGTNGEAQLAFPRRGSSTVPRFPITIFIKDQDGTNSCRQGHHLVIAINDVGAGGLDEIEGLEGQASCQRLVKPLLTEEWWGSYQIFFCQAVTRRAA